MLFRSRCMSLSRSGRFLAESSHDGRLKGIMLVKDNLLPRDTGLSRRVAPDHSLQHIQMVFVQRPENVPPEIRLEPEWQFHMKLCTRRIQCSIVDSAAAYALAFALFLNRVWHQVGEMRALRASNPPRRKGPNVHNIFECQTLGLRFSRISSSIHLWNYMSDVQDTLGGLTRSRPNS